MSVAKKQPDKQTLVVEMRILITFCTITNLS